MSFFAQVYLIELNKLDVLKEASEIVRKDDPFIGEIIIDHYQEFLQEQATFINEDENGFVLVDVWAFLEFKLETNLLESPFQDLAIEISEIRQNSTILLTFDHYRRYKDLFDPVNYTADEINEYNSDFVELTGEDYDQQLKKAMKAMKDYLERIPSDNWLLLIFVE